MTADAVIFDCEGPAQAEPLYQRALVIFEKTFGPEHSYLATSLDNLAELYRAQGRYAEAEPLYQRPLLIFEKAGARGLLGVATSLENYAALLRESARADEAEKMETRAKEIRAQYE